MSQTPEAHFHLHIHEGASPEAVRAAAEALRADLPQAVEPVAKSGESGHPDRTAEYVRRAYLDSDGKARPLLEFLADNPERLIPYPEISEHLDFPTSRSLPGLLGAFSRRADHRYEGVHPFEKKYTLDGWCLLMSKENSAIIDVVR